MDLYIANTEFENIFVLDSYNSLIWTDRYNSYGDFEIYTNMNISLLEYLKQDYYIRRDGSEYVMIIEKILIKSDVEEGDKLTVSGRSLESILDRRIIWGQKTVTGNLQDAIETLLNENIISPSKPERKIDNFIFEESTDEIITSLTIDAQYVGDNLYDVIKKICEERSIGFKITLNDNNQFVFKLYSGVDRSYEQTDNPYVVFSPSFDNLLSTNYMESKSSYKNVSLVGGEGEGSARKFTAVGNSSGMDRRELFSDASSISSEQEDGTTLSDAEYTYLLRQKGKEDLAENAVVVSMDGEAETQIMFKYGEDFYNGDIVQVIDAYGHDVRARVYEIVTSEDESGFSVYPTFTMIEEPQSRLPVDYIELQYIQSSGTQYINTKFKPNQNTRVQCVFELLESGRAYGIFGSRTAFKNTAFNFFAYANNKDMQDEYGYDSNIPMVSSLALYEIDKNKNFTTINNIEHTFPLTTFQSNYEMYIFAVNTSGSPNTTVNQLGSLRIYSCKIYDNDNLIRDFVPCKTLTGTVGLYDIVNQAFYTNVGTGSFIAGPSA